MMLHVVFVLAGLFASKTNAWNTDVHNQIGFAAEHFLTPLTTSVLQQLLEPQYNGSIGRAAAWADGYAHTHEGAFSYPWHWIDSEDQPPQRCNLDFSRDCSTEKGCVVRAIANQTEILRECVRRVVAGEEAIGGDGQDNLKCSYALKWVTHFIGDIHQPLHASGRAAGGNFIRVRYDNKSTELHAVWDGSIIHTSAQVSNFSTQQISPHFSSLVTRIQKSSPSSPSDFLTPPSHWLTCTDPSIPLLCATTWARESNTWTCAYVYKNSSLFDKNVDLLLESNYAKDAFKIVELQVAKAIVRLGEWLNEIVEKEIVLLGMEKQDQVDVKFEQQHYLVIQE